jgi:hypothetical protein
MINYIKKIFIENPCAKWFATALLLIWAIAFMSIFKMPSEICVATSFTAVAFFIFGVVVAVQDDR